MQDYDFYHNYEGKHTPAYDIEKKTSHKLTMQVQSQATIRKGDQRSRKAGAGGFGKYRFFCEECKKVFSKKQNWIDHQRKHDGTKLQCQYCEKSFQSLRGLELHTPVHTGKYPFRCSHCNAGFNKKRMLVAHENKQSQIYLDIKTSALIVNIYLF